MDEKYEKFKYIYGVNPIDVWEGALIARNETAERVLQQMPEKPRDGIVYKLTTWVTGTGKLTPVYLCKADNNGTIYLFSDYELNKKDLFSFCIQSPKDEV